MSTVTWIHRSRALDSLRVLPRRRWILLS